MQSCVQFTEKKFEPDIYKLEAGRSDKLVDVVKNIRIKNVGYDLNTATARDAKFNLVLDPDTVTHTSNVIMDQKLLSCRSIQEVSVSPPPTKSRIAAIELAPQTLLMPVVQEIFSYMASGNA